MDMMGIDRAIERKSKETSARESLNVDGQRDDGWVLGRFI